MLQDGKFEIKLGLPSGNAFPTDPAPTEGDVFYREDLDRIFAYDGANWQLIPLNNPCARAYHDANQLIGNAAWTALAFNSERFDTDAIHDLVVNNSRLTAKMAGIYQISASIQWEANAVGRRLLGIRGGGVTLITIDEMNPGHDGDMQTISTLWEFEEGHWIECVVFQTSGGNLNILSAAAYSPEFMMARVG